MYKTQVLLFAVVQFVILTFIAMYIFPGGSYHDQEATEYVFSKNYFSDLGSIKTYRGESNIPCLILFSVALGTIGVAMIHHSFILKDLFPNFFSQGVARGSLMLGGKSFLGVALFPLDLFPVEHDFFVKAGFLFLLFYVLSLIYLQLRMGVLKRKNYIVLNISYLLALIAYLYILFLGPSSKTHYGLLLRVVSQKIIVYFSILNLGLQSWAIHRIIMGRKST